MTVTDKELSEREREILRLCATGASNKEIAQQLYISTNTVKVHLRNIFGKIGVSSRTEAAMYAVNMGLANRSLLASETVSEIQSQVDESRVVETPAPASTKQALPLIWIIAAAFLIMSLIAGSLYFSNRQRNPIEAGISPVTGAPLWTTLAPMPTERYGMAIAAYGDVIYTIGGKSRQGVSSAVDIYEPGSDSWKEMASKPTAVQEMSAVVVGGKIYVPGGISAGGVVTDVLEIFDPQINQWTSGKPIPAAVSGYGLATFDGQIYLFGGWDGTAYRSEVYEYDPGADAWQQLASMPTPRAYLGTAVAGRRIIIVGGKNEKGILRANEEFSPDRINDPKGPWQTGKPLPYALYGMGITGMADVVYVLGGDGASGREFPALVYFVQTSEWQSLQFKDVKLGSDLGLANLGPYLFVMGGRIAGEPTNSNLKYQALYTLSLPIIAK
jgi:DNA-binding CsgD family transcriptional regulator